MSISLNADFQDFIRSFNIAHVDYTNYLKFALLAIDLSNFSLDFQAIYVQQSNYSQNS